jgi:tetratricopeptide (TPR) repeat protein
MPNDRLHRRGETMLHKEKTRSACAVLLMMVSATALANARSSDLVRQGVQKLEQRDYAGAARTFAAASQADPGDNSAAFFSGAAHNRLGEHDLALADLATVPAGAAADLDFELGWALMEQLRYKDAVAHLQAYERAHPGRGQTQEFLGRCYVALGMYSEASAAFDEAVRRDPRLSSSVNSYRAVMARKLGDPEAANRYFISASQDASSGDLQRTLQDYVRVAQAPPPPTAHKYEPKPLQLSGSLSFGYNDNVIGLADDTSPLPAGIDHKGSPFVQTEFAASGRMKLNPSNALGAGYSLLYDHYFDATAADLIDQTLYGEYTWQASPATVLILRPADNYTLIDGEEFRNIAKVKATVAHRFGGLPTDYLNDWIGPVLGATALSYEFGQVDYLGGAPIPQLDHDGYSHAFSLDQYLHSAGGAATVRLGYRFSLYDADGEAFTHYANTALFDVSAELPWARLQLQAGGSLSSVYYKHAPHITADNSVASNRADIVDAWYLRLTEPLTDHLAVFAQYGRAHDDSDDDFFSFSQNVSSLGVQGWF